MSKLRCGRWAAAVPVAAAWAMTLLDGSAHANVVVDLTSGTGSSGVINNALFIFDDTIQGGTGVLESFVRIQKTGIEQGYNTSGHPLPFDEKSGNWTHNIQMSDLTLVSQGGTNYYEFILDINESNNYPRSLISLDSLKIFTSAIGSQTTTDVDSLGTLRYDMDAIRDSMVLLDHAAAEGSGKSDMRFLVPVMNFAGASADDYVYLYSLFGATEGADDESNAGFEEWGLRVVPAPAAVSLLAVAALVPRRRRRR